MISHVAGIVTLIQDGVLAPDLGGISPPPIPHTAILPWVTVQEVSNIELESLSGRSNMQQSIMQINCWDKNQESALSLRETIKTLLLDYRGPAGELTIADIKHRQDSELYDGIRELHQVVVRLQVWWEI